MKPNSTNLFEELREMIESENDSYDDFRRLYPSTIDDYKYRGYIYIDDIIETPPAQVERELENHVFQDVKPGWVDVIESLAGEGNWGCHSGSYYFDLSKETIVYECLPNAEEETNEALAKELGLNPNEGKWLISKVRAEDNIDDYYHFASELFQGSEGQRYNVFAICSKNDIHAASFKNEEMRLIFLGVFALDRKKSFIHHRRIFHQIGKRLDLR